MNKNEVLKTFALKAKRRLVGRENSSSTAKIKVISNDDTEFRSKVEFLLSQEDLVLNPVHYLIDEKVFAKMNEQQKERELLTTLDKYTALRHQIEKMNGDTRFCM